MAPEFDHKALIASLPTQERQALLEQSDIQGLRHFGLHAGAIVTVGTLIAFKCCFTQHWGCLVWFWDRLY